MHRTVLRHSGVFRVLYDRQVQFGTETKGRTHGFIFENGLSIVGDRNRPGTLQGAEIGERRPATAFGGGSNRKYIDDRSAIRTTQPGYPVRRVHNGSGVRHRTN